MGQIVERSGVICLFPEGTRREGPDVKKIKPGIVQLALLHQVPIVPAGVAGTYKDDRGRFAVAIGEPILPDDLPESQVDLHAAQNDAEKQIIIKAIRQNLGVVRAAMQQAQTAALTLAQR